MSKGRRSNEGSKRDKKISAEGFDTNSEARLEYIVRGSRGRAVIGSHWNIVEDLWVHECVPSGDSQGKKCSSSQIT